MATPITHCIDPNPDIAGIGVRSSLYTQNILTILSAFIVVFDNDVDIHEKQFMKTACRTIMITTCSLLISAVVLAKTATAGLPLYHAIIILNMSWMSVLHCVTYGVVYLIYDAHHSGHPSVDMLKVVESIFNGSLLKAREQKFRAMAILAFAHCTAMGAFGMWVWISDATGGVDQRCTTATQTVLWGVSHSITSPILKKYYLTIYAIALLPFLNFGVLSMTILVVLYCIRLPFTFFRSNFFNKVCKGNFSQAFRGALVDAASEVSKEKTSEDLLATARVNGFLALGIILFLQVSLMVNTEQTISSNQSLMKKKEEASWTFGQTLALVMLILPLTDILFQLAHYPSLHWLHRLMEWLGVDFDT